MSETSTIKIRPARPEDLEAVRAIINREIAEGVAHFATEPQTAEEVAAEHERATTAEPAYPWFVAEVDGTVAGFARSGPWKPRQAYRWAVEISVYLAPAFQRKGLGRMLYTELFAELERLGYRRVIAGMTWPNPGSQRLHESFGMRLVGTFERIGFKNDQWHDTRYYQIDLPRS